MMNEQPDSKTVGNDSTNLRIMVVDDSKTMRQIVLRALESLAIHDTVEACDGREAIEKFQQRQFDLILTDWNMPQLNGLELLKEIRRRDLDIPIVMMTTEADKSQVMAAINAGASGYLLKPFGKETMKNLEEICNKLHLQSLQSRFLPTMNLRFVQPLIDAMRNAFGKLFDCGLKQGELFIRNNTQPHHDVSGKIGLSGKVEGEVVISLSRKAAFYVAKEFTKTSHAEINSMVVDSVGELANTIVGNAQLEISQMNLRMTPPEVIVGKTHSINYPPTASPFCIPFESSWGPVSLEVGLSEQPVSEEVED